MALYQRPGSPFWWYKFEVGGQRHRGSTGILYSHSPTDEREARRRAAARRKQERMALKYRDKAKLIDLKERIAIGAELTANERDFLLLCIDKALNKVEVDHIANGRKGVRTEEGAEGGGVI